MNREENAGFFLTYRQVILRAYTERVPFRFANGIEGFLMKPIDRSKLLKTVRKVLDEAKGFEVGAVDYIKKLKKTSKEK